MMEKNLYRGTQASAASKKEAEEITSIAEKNAGTLIFKEISVKGN